MNKALVMDTKENVDGYWTPEEEKNGGAMHE